jgi:hypothetical protein
MPPITAADARAKAVSARLQRIQQMRDAWKKPFHIDAAQPDTSNLPDPDDENGNGQDAVERRRSREHDARKVRLAEAWRGTTNPISATAIERQGEMWRGGR